MGWEVVGRLPVVVRPGSLRLSRTVGARVAADLWSVPTRAGVPAHEVLSDSVAAADLVADQPPPEGLRTARSASFLAWRYGFEPLHYRAVLLG
jgi:hypothetical protein